MSSFYWTCWEAGKQILCALALGIGVDEHHLLKHHSGDYNQLRLLHYPPIPAEAIEGGKFARMPAHTDWTTITLLFQDDCGGLQVEDPKRAGEFIDVAPVPGTLVMNVGDMLMRWSNGMSFLKALEPQAGLTFWNCGAYFWRYLDYLKSTSHRVQLPPRQDRYSGNERLTRARYSIPYFIAPDPDRMIECLRFDDEHPPKYEPITHRNYAAMRARMQYS